MSSCLLFCQPGLNFTSPTLGGGLQRLDPQAWLGSLAFLRISCCYIDWIVPLSILDILAIHLELPYCRGTQLSPTHRRRS